MLFRKKEEKAEPRICVGCGCLVARERAKEVLQDITNDAYQYSSTFICFEKPKPLFYCGLCAPPYDHTQTTASGIVHYFTHMPGHDEEVTKEGKPLKKKK